MAKKTSEKKKKQKKKSFLPIQVLNAAVQKARHYAFSLLRVVLWLITAIVLFFYRISKRSYNQIMSELNAKKTG